MVRSGHLRRLCALSVFLGLAFIGLGARLVVLQVRQHEKYRKIAAVLTQRYFLHQPRRSDILDANGNPLATSIPVKEVLVDPTCLGTHYAEVAHLLAPLVSWNEGQLAQRLRPVRTNEQGVIVTNRFVDLKRSVTAEQWQQISQAMAALTFREETQTPPPAPKRFYRNLRRRAVYAEDAYERVYPGKTLAAHVLGFVQERSDVFNDVSFNEMFGVDGIEAEFNNQLAGVRGWRVTETDNRQREIVAYREQEVEPRPGLDVVLTLDLVIQSIVETQLAEAMKRHSPVSVSSIVMRPRTGEILALATLPTYDPNRYSEFKPEEMRDRAITDCMEPGSTFKIVVVSAALNEGLITLDDTFNCERGCWWFMGQPLRDHDGGYGVLSVQDILSKSSNIGAAKIGVYKLGEQRLYDYMRAYGFGNKTGIALGGEVNGQVPPVKRWDKLTISRIPMGQSVGVTHLQMVMAMSAIANGGRLMRPLLVSRLQEHNGRDLVRYPPQLVRQVVTEATALQMVKALKIVATKGGTAAKAALEHYTVAGKTGTAQKVVNRVYAPGKYYSSFIGFFPADAPELCISVVFDEPQNGHFGGQIAAPVFKNIAEQVASYLKIHPDADELKPEPVTATMNNAPLNTASVRND
jgi:cell division protein FtsI/penicillin-binding protein 2